MSKKYKHWHVIEIALWVLSCALAVIGGHSLLAVLCTISAAISVTGYLLKQRDVLHVSVGYSCQVVDDLVTERQIHHVAEAGS